MAHALFCKYAHFVFFFLVALLVLGTYNRFRSKLIGQWGFLSLVLANPFPAKTILKNNWKFKGLRCFFLFSLFFFFFFF